MKDLKFIFLAVAYHIKGNNPDPDDKFIKRFKNNKPRVKKYSACKSSIGGVIDKETGKKGIIFYATDIKWLNDEEVEVTGGYYIDGKGEKVSIYYVILKDGHWIVIGEKNISMS